MPSMMRKGLEDKAQILGATTKAWTLPMAGGVCFDQLGRTELGDLRSEGRRGEECFGGKPGGNL